MKQDIMNLPNAVEIPNNCNTRHFGGYVTDDGRTVIREKLIRSGKPEGFGEEDIQILLKEYNLKTVIDLRASSEMEASPSLCNVPGVTYEVFDLLGDFVTGATRDAVQQNVHQEQETTNPWVRIFTSMGVDTQMVVDGFGRVYLQILQNEHSQKDLRRIFDILLEQSEGSVLFHCMGGKDRTGVLAVLILSALGVDWDTCVKDYLMTNAFFADSIEEELDGVRKDTDDPEIIEAVRSMAGVDERYMEMVNDMIQKEYGSMDNYLSEVLLLTEDKIAKLRSMYTK